MSHLFLYFLIALLFVGVSLTFGRSPIRAGRYGLFIAAVIALAVTIFMTAIQNFVADEQQEALMLIPIWMASYLALVNSYRFLVSLITERREMFCRNVVLGFSVRRTIVPFLREYSNASIRAILGPDLISALPRVILVAGILDLASLVLPWRMLGMSLLLSVILYTGFFALATAIVVKSWDINRRFDRRS